MDRRLKINSDSPWRHHRSGWADALAAVRPLHHPRGVQFEGFLEGVRRPLTAPFVGVLHHTPRHPTHLHPFDQKAKYDRVPDLTHFFEGDTWQRSEPHCRGLLTLSEHTAAFVRNRTAVPVCALKHPRAPVGRPFQWRGRPRSLLFVGSWLRDFRPFFHLSARGYEKAFLLPFPWVKKEVERLGLEGDRIRFRVGVSPQAYDRALRRSVVFLSLFDASAVNTVLDCLFFHTPLVVNRLPALQEYLGRDYPLFYTQLEEAEALLQDAQAIERGHEYLRQKDRTPFSFASFSESLVASPVYQELPSQ